MRGLIKRILKEEVSDTKSELIRRIKDEGLFSVAELVGGLENLKKILKDNPSMVERIENQKGIVKVSWTTDGDNPSIVLPFKIIDLAWNRWMTNSWPIINVSYNENTLTEDENYKFKDFLYDSFYDESSVKVLKLNSDETRMDQNYVQLGEINGKTRQQNTTSLDRSYTLLDIQYIIEKLGEGNIIREEADNNKGIQKNLRTINILLKQVSWEGLCDIWVEYNPVDKDYEIRSKSTQRHFDHDEIIKELDFLDNGIRSMGLNVYIYTPLYVEDCEDEVKFMNESINKSDEKRNKIIEKIMDDIIFPEYNHIICGYDVKNDKVFNEPVVNVTFIGGYGTKLWPMTQGIQKMYRDILDEIWDTIYDYINIPVGVTMETTPKCNEQENIYLRESIDKSENKKFNLVKDIIYNMFDNVGVEYNSKDNEIMVYYDKQEELVPIEICDVINNYTGLNVVPWYEYDKNRIGKEPDFYLDSEAYDEELNENYSPAGKEITPNNIVIHKSNPVWRENILKTGLQVSAGECYKTYVGYGVKCKPAIFATNSTNKRAWFDSTYDDDIWEINTEMIPDVKWYKDRHFESSKKHIVTFENIPADAITLKHEGTGKDWGLMESTNDDKLSKETMMGTFQDIVEETLEEIKHNCEELDADSFAGWLNFDTCDVVDSIDKINIVNIERKKGISRKGISRIPMFEVDVNITFNSISAWIDYDDFMYTMADRIIGKWKIRFIFNIKEQENSNKREMWEYARTLKNARTQGSKLRFPKSAVKANPMRFRPYNR